VRLAMCSRGLRAIEEFAGEEGVRPDSLKKYCVSQHRPSSGAAGETLSAFPVFNFHCQGGGPSSCPKSTAAIPSAILAVSSSLSCTYTTVSQGKTKKTERGVEDCSLLNLEIEVCINKGSRNIELPRRQHRSKSSPLQDTEPEISGIPVL
jgi:hypothetical protein